MKATMDMSSHEFEQDSMEAEYGDDILYAGWNPEVESVSQQLQLAPTTEQQDISAAPRSKMAKLFLGRMYSFQRQFRVGRCG
jgi:hypothetical protein